MPIIKPSEKADREIVRLNLDVSVMNKVKKYCDWVGVKKVDEFFQQAAEFVFSKDKGWLAHEAEKCAAEEGE